MATAFFCKVVLNSFKASCCFLRSSVTVCIPDTVAFFILFFVFWKKERSFLDISRASFALSRLFSAFC
ncbi:hypothetical protein MT325_m256R [Paramecium bursaria chlorella virus MT325]|uniref:Uncharacterized protein m256R n=1 Tax=Paramecium bursaria Chlorella virus MT325 TaxID=346932 RepID=A7ITY6_PBCVM|nr:hypothetical protein MT325_m256R [Paramecium bursaria chlorella virus MT325]